MSWELVEKTTLGLKIGQFGCKKVKNSMPIPNNLKNESFNWYLDEKLRIAKLQVEEGALNRSQTTISLPKKVRETIKEEMCVVFLDEDVMYFSPYSKGQEYLQAFLKKK